MLKCVKESRIMMRKEIESVEKKTMKFLEMKNTISELKIQRRE